MVFNQIKDRHSGQKSYFDDIWSECTRSCRRKYSDFWCRMLVQHSECLCDSAQRIPENSDEPEKVH